MNCNNYGAFSGGALVTTAAALSLAIAQGRSAEQLELLALFFTSLADNLALYAGQLPAGDTEVALP